MTAVTRIVPLPLIAAACATLFTTVLPAQRLPAAIGTPATASLVWPNGTDEPARIAFRATLASERDIGKRQSGMARFRAMLDGRQESLTPVKRPYDVVITTDRRVLVSDGARSQVLIFDPATNSVSFLGEEGPGRGRLVKPMGLGVKPMLSYCRPSRFRHLIRRGRIIMVNTLMPALRYRFVCWIPVRFPGCGKQPAWSKRNVWTPEKFAAI